MPKTTFAVRLDLVALGIGMWAENVPDFAAQIFSAQIQRALVRSVQLRVGTITVDSPEITHMSPT
jgi:hypothetical protein